jgi:hypothetical protein
MTNASPSPQISFGEEEPAVEEDPEVGARFGNNNKQGGLLASVLGKIVFISCFSLIICKKYFLPKSKYWGWVALKMVSSQYAM